MALQAQFAPPGIFQWLPDLKALFKRRPSPETSWRYEPPSTRTVDPPYNDKTPMYETHAYEGTLGLGALEPPASPGHTPSNAQAIQDHLQLDISAACSAEDVAGIPEPLKAMLEDITEDPRPSVDVPISKVPSEASGPPPLFTASAMEKAIKREVKKRVRHANRGTAIAEEDVREIYRELLQMGEKFLKPDNLNNLRIFVKQYVEVVSRLHATRHIALEALCRRAFVFFDANCKKRGEPAREKTAFTLLLLESILACNPQWPVQTIASCLMTPELGLPSLARRLKRTAKRRKSLSQNAGVIHDQTTADASESEVFDEQTELAAQIWIRAPRLLYEIADWARFIDEHSQTNQPDKLHQLRFVGTALIVGITEQRPMQVSVDNQVVDISTFVSDFSTEYAETGSGEKVRQIFDKYMLPLIQKHLLLAHDALTSSTKADLLSALSKPDMHVHAIDEDALLATAQEKSAVQAAVRDAVSNAWTYFNELIGRQTPLLRFKSVLDFAVEHRILPLRYRSASAKQLMPLREKIIHQLAYQYAIDSARSLQQNQRSLHRLLQYLTDESLPIGSLFSRSMVHAFITRPMLDGDFVSAKTAQYVNTVVRPVEGELVANKIQGILYHWKGCSIKAARDRYLELGIDEKARIKTLKNVGVPLWKEPPRQGVEEASSTGFTIRKVRNRAS